MKIEVNITKTNMVIILSAIFFVGGMIFAFAYNSSGTSGNPAVMGHSVDEIDWSKAINSTVGIGSRLYVGLSGTENGYSLIHFKNGNSSAGGVIRASQGTGDSGNAPLDLQASIVRSNSDICIIGGKCLSQVGSIACSWYGTKVTSGNQGGCADDVYITCDGTKVTAMAYGC